eukprot:scpid10575/ scgid10867/ Coiled-coil domain-containing protein 61
MSSDVFLTAQHEFKGDEYLVTVRSSSSPDASSDSASRTVADTLLVEVENTSSYEQWSNDFTAKYVEDLSSKTGNFKPFATFLHMFQAALLKKSDTVGLDLLTLADLEKLRRQKSGNFSSLGKPLQTSNKRYLILTYNVEFDRIHYPLVLQNRGQLDPIQLLTSLREVQREDLRSRQGRKHNRDAEAVKLRRQYDDLVAEKDEVEQQLATEREKARFADKGSDSKKTEVLKSVIRTLEGDLIQERTKHQRFAAQKRDAMRDMQEELDELRSNEHTLHMRIKYLTNDLAAYKRNQSYGPYRPERTASAERSRGRSWSPKPHTSSAPRGTRDTAPRGTRDPVTSWRGPAEPSPPAPASRRQPARQSFSGGAKPRFDPTAYIRAREERQQEAARRRGRSMSRSPSPSAARRSRSNSVDSYAGHQQSTASTRTHGRPPAVPSTSRQHGRAPGSRNSSLERRSSSLERLGQSMAKTPKSSKPPTGRGGSGGTGARGRTQRKQAWPDDSPASKPRKSQHKPRVLNASPDDDTMDYDETRIADIGARLNHLRTFMQASFPDSHH